MTDDEIEVEGEIRASMQPGSDGSPSSPGSSGYAGEGGSTTVTSDSQFEIHHEEIQQDNDDDGTRIEIDRISISDSHANWIPGKRHPDEVCAVILVHTHSSEMDRYKYRILFG